jgi:hypothetical protein
MTTVRALDVVDALGMVPRLCQRHREEILRTHASLEKWARGRAALGGYALVVDGEVQVIGGVTPDGTLWIAGAMGWERYLKHVLRVFRAAREVYPALRCQCYADNYAAQHLVERLGFERGRVENGLVEYAL